MPRKAVGLSAVKVRTAPPGRYGDGGGLYLLVRHAEARFWVFRYMAPSGRIREMGLGPAIGQQAISLADARIKARRQHDTVRDGRDPLVERAVTKRADAVAARRAEARATTFSQIADTYVTAHGAGWRSAKHRQQWRRTLETYAFPALGDLPVAEVDTAAVMSVIEAIWNDKPETASRLRGRIESVLDYAKARGWRDGENPARWRGHIANMLPSRTKIRPVRNHPALPWPETGRFMAELTVRSGMAALALRFLILTAARAGEVTGMTWDEIDSQAAIWTVPAARMKAMREHRVPLAAAAMAILEVVAPLRGNTTDAWVFPGARDGRALSASAILKALRAMERRDLTAHGFRSTFRDWAAETGQPNDLAEAALAHTLGNKVQAAYQRGDLLGRRRMLMAAWSAYCAGTAPDGQGPPLSSARRRGWAGVTITTIPSGRFF